MKLMILPILALWTAFSLTSGDEGDSDLHKELIRKTEEQNWQIITGGNEVYQIDIKRRKRTPIMTMADQSKYVWSMASLSPDGEWLALERSPRRPPFKKDLVLVNWRDFFQSSKPFDELVQTPIPGFDVEGFSWAPDKHVLAIKVRKTGEGDHRQDKNSRFRIYEFSLETKQLKELPIEQFDSLEPNTWSSKGPLVYKSEDNTIERFDAEDRGETLPNISNLAMYDFNSGEVTNLFPGDFPSWNHKGLLTYMDSPRESLAVLAPPKRPGEGHQYKDRYYTYDLETGDRKLLLENKHPRGENGSIFSSITWSPDDQYILYGRQTSFTGSFDDLYAMEVATGRETLICRGVDRLFAGHASWVALPQKKRTPSKKWVF